MSNLTYHRIAPHNYGVTIRRLQGDGTDGSNGIVYHINIREYVKGDWELTINGRHEGYFGRLKDAKAHAEELV